MILSFHPCFVADRNRLCAGRAPDGDDLRAIRRAAAVVLPQGCRPDLYALARRNCPRVFPDYNARFSYPGKTGQARMFAAYGIAAPRTLVFEAAAELRRTLARRDGRPPLAYPLVFKLDSTGEGQGVWLITTRKALDQALRRATAGFVLQEFIPHAGRSLRVVVMGTALRSYWRVQADPATFGTSLAQGAVIDETPDPALMPKGHDAVRHLCRRSGINLGGVDVIFNSTATPPAPLVLEVNYFFGRRGLGGAEAYYARLERTIHHWLAEAGLAVDGDPQGDQDATLCL